MLEQEVQIAGQAGLHARPAALFVQAAQRFTSRVWVARGEKRVDGKSLLGLLSLGATAGSTIVIGAEGADAAAAVAHLAGLVRSGFGEG
jgi:phosphocarrier protein HPr